MGAFQAGALLALLDAGLRADLVHGSSVGALNAVFLAVRPDPGRARELARWWGEPSMVGVLRPGWLPRLRGLTGSVRRGGALVDVEVPGEPCVRAAGQGGERQPRGQPLGEPAVEPFVADDEGGDPAAAGPPPQAAQRRPVVHLQDVR
jgi:hypothetical protein